MLKIRTFNDFPEIFRDGKADIFLSEEELAKRSEITDSVDERAYLLKVMTAKELANLYLSKVTNHWLPYNTMTVTYAENGEGWLSCDFRDLKGLQIPIAVWKDNEFAVASVEAAHEGKRFMVDIKRVETRYPFQADQYCTERELLRIATMENLLVQKIMTSYVSFKEGLWRIYGELPTFKSIEIQDVDPHDVFKLSVLHEGSSPPTIFGRYWIYEESVMTYAATYEGEPQDPKVLLDDLEWV